MTKDTYTVAAAPPPEVEGTEGGELNYDDLQGKEVVVKITRQQEWEVGQPLQLVWKGTTADGRTLPTHAQTQELTADDKFKGATVKVANEHAKAVVGGRALLYYKVNYEESSETLTLSITGSAGLCAPVVDEARGGALSPDRVPTSGATVRVKFQASMELGDRVVLIATFTDKEGNEVVEKPPKKVFLNKNDLTFDLRQDYIKAATDGKLKVEYTLDPVNGEIDTPSDSLDLRVGYGLIPPELEGELGLPPGEFIKVVVPKYTGMEGDEIAISIELPGLKYRSPGNKSGNIEDLTFFIPSGIFISALSTSATVHYHVIRKTVAGEAIQWDSQPLNVSIVGQDPTINPPKYLSLSDNDFRYRLSYQGISADRRVKIYWHKVGSPARHIEREIKYDGDISYVSIPKDWVMWDKLNTVCGNYAIIQNDGAVKAFSPGVIFKP